MFGLNDLNIDLEEDFQKLSPGGANEDKNIINLEDDTAFGQDEDKDKDEDEDGAVAGKKAEVEVETGASEGIRDGGAAEVGDGNRDVDA